MSSNISSTKRGREKFRKVRSVIRFTTFVISITPCKFRVFLLNLFRNTPGLFGLGLRYSVLKTLAQSSGDNVSIFQGVYLLNATNLSIGENVSIQPMSYIDCGYGKEVNVIIGDNVSIAHNVTILCTSHIFQNRGLNIKDQGLEQSKVIIGDDVWIGAKSTILAGVTIGKGCVIGANSVVTHSTIEYGVYAGTPARLIRKR